MPADLTVVAVKLPPLLVAPCPLPVLVVIQNIGTDPADRTPFDVTIDLGFAEALVASFEETVRSPEDQQLSPGRTIVVPVHVQFPCMSPVTLRATVDKRQQIPNNLRSAPFKDVTGLNPIPVPWLVTTLRVGIQDASGIVTFDPDGFCPGRDVVAEISIENRGCVAAKASTTEVTLEDPQAVPPPLASQMYLLPALAPGTNHVTSFSFATPSSASATSGLLAVQVRADTGVANPDQCDRAQLDARVVKPFGVGGPPQLTLNVGDGGTVFPGETPSLSWRVSNQCSDIGPADVKVLFGSPSTQLYGTNVTIPVGSTVGEDADPSRVTIPSAISAGFWSVGTKSLDLEVNGSGTDPGPYRISVPLNVVPEPINASWWLWDPQPPLSSVSGFVGGNLWKSGYTVSGSFTNLGVASMTIIALSAVEHPTDVTGTSQDQTVTPFTGTGMLVMPGKSVRAAWLRKQAWPWLAKGTGIELGPRQRTFSYVANFSVTDQFGNTYPTVATFELLAPVEVSQKKIIFLEGGRVALSVGLYLLMAAGIAAASATTVYQAIAAAIIALIGMGFIIGATLAFYDAYDPPIPDFREREPELLVDPQAWTIPEPDDERLHPLHTLALLVTRAVSARVRALHHRDRAWAAYLDHAQSRLVRYRDDARHELETLRRLVNATTDTANEADDVFDQLLDGLDAVPTPEELRDIAGRFAEEFQLNDQERAIIDEQLAAVDEADIRESIELARSNGLGPVSEVVRTIYETTASEFAEREYLR